MGRALKIDVTAEGVETLEHAHILRDMGCTTLQGYYFARPMDGAGLLAFIAKEAWRDTPAMGERAA
ncbi:MAG: EAL domain-containing protein [Hyphomicrobiales bacterium]|nr:EAL domain-containing protein [Hyphomicrobiales bacterium]